MSESEACVCAFKESQALSRQESERCFLAEEQCLKPWCSGRERDPFRDLNASVATMQDSRRGRAGRLVSHSGQTWQDPESPVKILAFILRAMGNH